jgi:hypothetical protein
MSMPQWLERALSALPVAGAAALARRQAFSEML